MRYMWSSIEDTLRKYFQFRGRSGRREFWTWAIMVLAVSVVVVCTLAGLSFILDNAYNSVLSSVYKCILISLGLFWFAMFIPSLTVCVRRLRDAGISVEVGVLEEECKALNRRFFTFHREKRPYIILKWAQTANGFLDNHFKPVKISSDYTSMLSHKLRAEEDAILVGRITNERDKPQLTVRHWVGPDPKRLVIDHQHPLNLESLHAHHIQSLIVEGGAETLRSFLVQNLWDEIRVETNTTMTVSGGTRAPQLPANAVVISSHLYGSNQIVVYRR